MNERLKIAEAEYFLVRMEENRDRHEYFYYNLSAFLSASRSVLQFALEEAKLKAGGQAWYDQTMQANEVLLGFMRDQRDENIHKECVGLKRSVSITIPITGTVLLPNGEKIHYGDKSVSMKKENGPFQFLNWSGAEDVIQICSQSISELKMVVDAGVKKSFIAG